MVPVIFLQQAEGELVINQEAVIACPPKWITNIAIFRVTELALVTFYPLGCAETLSCVQVTDICMATTCASCALPAIGWVSIVTRHAVLTLSPSGEILTLLTDIVVDARAVSVTLASWTLDKRPLVVLLLGAQTGVKNHLAVVYPGEFHWAPRRPFDAISSSCITRVIAPATPRLFQALSTGSQSRTILRRAGGSLPLQALSIGEGDDVSVGVHTALGAAAPHALHAVACAVGAGGSQGAWLLARPCVLIWAHDRLFTNEPVCHGRARVCF